MKDKTYDDSEVGQRIKQLREQENISQERFSEMVNISNYYLYQLERGSRHASLPVTIRIAEALNVSLDYLIYGDKTITADKNEVIELVNKASNRQLEIIKTVLLNLKK